MGKMIIKQCVKYFFIALLAGLTWATPVGQAWALDFSGPRFFDPAVPIQIEVGQEFALVLDSNPTTGYQWQLMEQPDLNVLTLVIAEYQGAASDLVGAGGKDIWVFQANGPGRAVIKLAYRRPWEASVKPARLVTYVIFVQPTEAAAAAELAAAEAKSVISAKAQQVIGALQNKEFIKFAGFFHPDLGVRFSPSAQVKPETDVVLKAADVPKLLASGEVLDWGSYGGPSRPIKLSLAGYYRRFIYDGGYALSRKIGYNQVLGRSNTANNVFEIYPGAVMVEFYLPGESGKNKGFDWKSLRLIFAKKDYDWFLVGLVHDEWTI